MALQEMTLVSKAWADQAFINGSWMPPPAVKRVN
jgi:hypothetical protein